MYYVYHIRRKAQKTLTEGYIGVSTNYKTRWIHHKHHLKAGTHCNPHLQNAWHIYQDIEFVLLHTCNTKEEMLQYEVLYRAKPNIGWNCKSGGELYFKHSEETKEKIRRYNTGKKYSLESRAKMSEAAKARPGNRLGSSPSIETREKLRQANLGKKQSTDTKAKRALSQTKYKEQVLWLHTSGLFFYGSPSNLKNTYKSMKLQVGSLIFVYKEKYNKHKGWYLCQ